jgi:hypothetical protein
VSVDFTTPFVAAFALWRRDRAILFPLAGLLFFVPQLAVLLLVPNMPQPVQGETSEEAARAWAEAFSTWAAAHGGWYIAAQFATLFATLTIATLYVDPARPATGAALGRALGILPRYVLAMILVTLPIGGLLLMGLPFRALLFVVLAPVFYILARVMLMPAILVAERPVGAIGAIGRSWRLTAGNGWVITCIYATVMLAGMFVGSLFLAVAQLAGQNPVVVASMSLFGAGVASLSALAQALIGVVLYGRLASKGT